MLYWLQSDSPDEANAVTHWLRSSVIRPLGPLISSGFASTERYVTVISDFVFSEGYFWFMFYVLNFRAVPGSCFQNFFRITRLRSPFLGVHVFTSLSITSSTEFGGGELKDQVLQVSQ